MLSAVIEESWVLWELKGLTGEDGTVQFSSVQSLSRVWLFATPWIAAHQASLSITNSWSLFKLSPLSRWCHPTISSYVVSFPSCLQSFSASGSFQMSHFFTSKVAVAKVLEFQLQHQSFQWIFRTDFLYDWLVGSPCSPRDSQKSSLEDYQHWWTTLTHHHPQSIVYIGVLS